MLYEFGLITGMHQHTCYICYIHMLREYGRENFMQLKQLDGSLIFQQSQMYLWGLNTFYINRRLDELNIPSVISTACCSFYSFYFNCIEQDSWHTTECNIVIKTCFKFPRGNTQNFALLISSSLPIVLLHTNEFMRNTFYKCLVGLATISHIFAANW